MSQIRLPNPHLEGEDFLYHFGLSTNDDLKERFGDVKFLCMGGKPSRMRNFANSLYEKLEEPENSEFEESENEERTLRDIAASAGRYALYKVGPVLSASHGIGTASMSVALHELLKLMYHAGCTGVTVIRIGTSGGIGVDPGTVVVTHQAYNSLLEPQYRQVACGKVIYYNSKTCRDLAEEIVSCANDLEIACQIGNTMSTDDFYEEQCRLDGAMCSFTEDDKMDFLQKAFNECGIVNIEMESAGVVAMCNRANVKSAVVCVTVVNRHNGDQVTSGLEVLKEWETLPQVVVTEFIRRSLLSKPCYSFRLTTGYKRKSI